MKQFIHRLLVKAGLKKEIQPLVPSYVAKNSEKKREERMATNSDLDGVSGVDLERKRIAAARASALTGEVGPPDTKVATDRMKFFNQFDPK